MSRPAGARVDGAGLLTVPLAGRRAARWGRSPDRASGTTRDAEGVSELGPGFLTGPLHNPRRGGRIGVGAGSPDRPPGGIFSGARIWAVPAGRGPETRAQHAGRSAGRAWSGDPRPTRGGQCRQGAVRRPAPNSAVGAHHAGGSTRRARSGDPRPTLLLAPTARGAVPAGRAGRARSGDPRPTRAGRSAGRARSGDPRPTLLLAPNTRGAVPAGRGPETCAQLCCWRPPRGGQYPQGAVRRPAPNSAVGAHHAPGEVPAGHGSETRAQHARGSAGRARSRDPRPTRRGKCRQGAVGRSAPNTRD